MSDFQERTETAIVQLKRRMTATNATLARMQKEQDNFIQTYKPKIEPGLGKSDLAGVLGAVAAASIGFSLLKVDETGVFVAGRQVVTWRHMRTPDERLQVAERKLEQRTDRLQGAVNRFQEQLERVEQRRRDLEETRQRRAQPGGDSRALYGEQRFREEALSRELRALEGAERRAQQARGRVEGSRQRVVSAAQRIAQAEQEARNTRRETVNHMNALDQGMRTLETRAASLRRELGS
ncbi:hypothetical protein [Streptomyces sp. NPDC059455]|uniref:hypothetical protein n=1 Tax=Streptomyces sp. NPDC059455 TaxID=3346837 RepID=UPI0036870FBA